VKRRIQLLLSAAWDFPPYYLNALLRRAGLAETHRDYRPFVVVSRARTGTNMLRSILNGHGHVLAFGEVFRSPEFIGWALPGYPRIGPLRRRLVREPVRFLDEVVFGAYPRRFEAVGFKLFYTHARQPDWLPVWDRLQERRDVVVIHMRRRNVLKAVLSFQRAARTGVWESRGRRVRDPGPIALDYGHCRYVFEQDRRGEEECAARFAGHPRLDLLYEDLVRDRPGQMQRVYEALGVAPRDVAPATRRQGTRPLSESIANYADLKARFAGTPWEAYFED
jgi:LPS sulfotransferase NodH